MLLAGCDRDPVAPQLLGEFRPVVQDGQATVTVDIDLPAHPAVEIVLEPTGLDVRAELVDSRGTVRTADAPNDRLGVMTFHEPAAARPRHIKIRIVGEDHARNHGTVAIVVRALAERDAAERTRLRAVRLEADACRDFAVPGRGEAAAARFEQAADLRAGLGDHSRSGLNRLQAAGAVFARGKNWQRAAELAAAAATRIDAATAPDHAVRAIRLEGAALQAMAESATGDGRTAAYAAARKRLSAAADMAQHRNLPYEGAYAFNYRGVGYQYEGRAGLARADYEQALQLFTRAAHDPGRSMSIDSLALLHHEQGEFRAAVARFDEALALTSADESPAGYAYTLHNSALPLRVLGEFDQAIARYSAAAAILRGIDDREGEARELQGIAIVLLHAGEPARASALLQEVLRMRGEHAPARETFSALSALADVERDAGRMSAAQALLVRARPLAGSVTQESRVRLGQAKVARQLHDVPSARALISEVLDLPLPPSHPHRGEAWLELATLEGSAGRAAAATAAFTASLAVATNNGAELDAARVLAARAAFLLETGDPIAALADTRRALTLLESVGDAGTHAQQRAVFYGSQRRVFETQIAAQLALADKAQRAGRAVEAEQARFDALATSERSRMGGLLQALGRRDTAQSAALAQRRRELYELLAGKRQRREVLLEQTAPSPTQLAELTRSIERLRVDLAALDAKSTAGDDEPALRGKVEPEGRQLARIVPGGDLLAEYFLGDTRAWLFLVRDRRLEVLELPGVGSIDAEVRATIDRLRTVGGDGRLAVTGPVLQRTLLDPLLATDPVARLWLVADGSLHALPLAALINQGPGWMQTAEVATVPSLRAAALASSRLRRSRPPGEDDARVAVIADPVFTLDDPRLGLNRGAQGIAATGAPVTGARPALLTRSTVALGSLQRLPATAAEARAIEELLPAGQARVLTGPAANREALLRTDLQRLRYLHFATHAFADSEDPALSALVLSRFSADGRPIDGTLRLHDVETLRLNADLVVLSGCETALGRNIRGEGVIGLSYAFLQAGARTVVASLWQVPDTATAALMREFYRQLLGAHRSPAEALRLAQQAVRSRPRWADPYYWAGFQVVTLDPDSMNHAKKEGDDDA